MTYSLTRFAIYETTRDYMTKDSKGPLPFYSKVLLGGISGEHWAGRVRAGWRPRAQEPSRPDRYVTTGLTGGYVGTPADLVNVRFVCPFLPQGQGLSHSQAGEHLPKLLLDSAVHSAQGKHSEAKPGFS